MTARYGAPVSDESDETGRTERVLHFQQPCPVCGGEVTLVRAEAWAFNDAHDKVGVPLCLEGHELTGDDGQLTPA